MRPLCLCTALTVMTVLSACGGGGGGGGGSGGTIQNTTPLVYTGSTSQAIVTASNAGKIIANALGGSGTAAAGAVTGVAVAGPVLPRSAGLNTMGRRLAQALRREPIGMALPSTLLSGMNMDRSQPCDAGSMLMSGMLDDVTHRGTLAVSYSDCRYGPDTISGQATLRVDALDPTIGTVTDGTFTFSRLNFRTATANWDMGGWIQMQTSLATSTETLTQDIVMLDNATGSMFNAQVVLVHVYNSLVMPTRFTQAMTGRIFDRTEGFVDIATPTLFVYPDATQEFPSSGEAVFTGSGGTSIRAIALSHRAVALALDVDGDGTRDRIATLGWSDLSGPAAANLDDTDGDGMHDSWETAYALSDGRLDKDGDGTSNRAEYLGGMNPGSPASIPAGAHWPYAIAGGLASASSDTLNPGRHAVATDGTTFLLVSRQQTDMTNAAPLSRWTARMILAPGSAAAPFDLLPANADPAGHAAAAFDGTNYLVVTTLSGSLSGQRVSASGVVLDAAPGLPIAASGTLPAIAYGGGTYLLAYIKGGAQKDLFGVLVNPSGAVGSEFVIHTGSAGDVQSAPSVAFDGANFLVAWERAGSLSGPGSADILGARVASDGTLVGGTFPISTAAEAQSYPQVACDGTNCLAIWIDRRDYPGQSYNFSPGPGDVYGARISNANAVLDTTGIAVATGVTANAGYPGLAFNGAEYVVAWSRGAYVNNPGGPTGIYAARVRTDGSANLGGAINGVALSGEPESSSRLFYVALASGGTWTLVTWLNNREMAGTTKSVDGALLYPLQ
jgi:hypothetical protein